MHEQKRPDANAPDQNGDSERNSKIGRHGAEPGPPAAAAQHSDRQPLLEDKWSRRADAEHDDRMSVKPIAKAAPRRARQIFAHRERFNLAQATTVEIPRAGVMGSVLPTPKVTGRQCQHADDP